MLYYCMKLWHVSFVLLVYTRYWSAQQCHCLLWCFNDSSREKKKKKKPTHDFRLVLAKVTSSFIGTYVCFKGYHYIGVIWMGLEAMEPQTLLKTVLWSNKPRKLNIHIFIEGTMMSEGWGDMGFYPSSYEKRGTNSPSLLPASDAVPVPVCLSVY